MTIYLCSTRSSVIQTSERGGFEDLHAERSLRQWCEGTPDAEPLAGSRTGAAASQFSALLQRTTDFSGRHLDADRGAVMAGVSAHRFGLAAGVGWVRQPDSRVSDRPAGWNYRRSFESAAGGDCHADRLDDPRLRTGSAHADAPREGLAHLRAGGAAGGGECLRHPRPAGVPGGYGRQRRPDECHRPELLDV